MIIEAEVYVCVCAGIRAYLTALLAIYYTSSTLKADQISWVSVCVCWRLGYREKIDVV